MCVVSIYAAPAQVDAGVADELVLGDPTAPRFVYWEKKLRPTPSGEGGPEWGWGLRGHARPPCLVYYWGKKLRPTQCGEGRQVRAVWWGPGGPQRGSATAPG